ncbi:MAG: hypothetical protein ABSH28_12465, partial [Acidobacteriota bacterium]
TPSATTETIMIRRRWIMFPPRNWSGKFLDGVHALPFFSAREAADSIRIGRRYLILYARVDRSFASFCNDPGIAQFEIRDLSGEARMDLCLAGDARKRRSAFPGPAASHEATPVI